MSSETSESFSPDIPPRAVAGENAGRSPSAHGGLFSSLYVRNYRLFFFGMLVSNIGLWMFRIAQDWLVLTELTARSSSSLGLITGLQFLPVLLFSAYAGGLVDRFDKRKLLMITQLSAFGVAVAQAALVVTGMVQLVHVMVLAFASGAVTAVDNPARQAFVSEMVGDTDLTNAVGLNSTQFNASRLIGPGLAGLLIGVAGVGPAFVINAASYLATLFALVAMNTGELHPAPRRRGRGSVREGISYVRTRPDIMLVMFALFMLATFGLNFQVTNLLMANDIFHTGPERFGLMGTVQAIGTVTGAILAAARRSPSLKVIVLALAGFCLGMGVMTVLSSYWVYLVFLVWVGFCALTVLTSANAYLQLSVPPGIRGRVMSLYLMVAMGGTPLGAPIIGWLGDAFGARATVLVGAIGTGVAVLVAVVALHRGSATGSAVFNPSG